MAGILVLAAVAAWQLNAAWWSAHSTRAGHALAHRFLDNHALAAPLPHRGPTGQVSPAVEPPSTKVLAACSAGGSSSSATPVSGLLEIPSLSVAAPVEQGMTDAVLAAAVGHDPASVWPGLPGKAVLEAHDVSYFATISRLAPGDTLRYVTPCTTYVFSVTTHAVVHEGAPVYDTATPTIALVTCWPTDALWFTPDRYIVTAKFESQTPTSAASTSYLGVAPPPSPPVPAKLAAQGVTTTTYALPMGTFTLTGSPEASWAQTTSPLLAANSATEAFIASVRALTEDHLDWWRDLAPGLGAPAPLVGAHNPRYLGQLDVAESASGTRPTSFRLTDKVSVSGGRHPGTYSLSVTEVVDGQTLTVSAWSMRGT